MGLWLSGFLTLWVSGFRGFLWVACGGLWVACVLSGWSWLGIWQCELVCWARPLEIAVAVGLGSGLACRTLGMGMGSCDLLL